MAREAVFYFDVLGFSHKARGAGDAAIDALTALAELLGTDELARWTGQWEHRYSLSDSVFLTHSNPVRAVQQASALIFNLVHLRARSGAPVLVRGALALGEVRHLKGIFLDTPGPANLVGPAVVDAVELERAGLKGPRVLLSEELANILHSADKGFARWQLRPTAVSGVWELLWLLPPRPEDLKGDELSLKDISDLSIQLLRAHGGHPGYGAHYREFVLLVGRCLERARDFVRTGEADLTIPLTKFMPAAEVAEICNSVSGLPDEYVGQLVRFAELLAT
jgi:hypothetical protein